MQKEGLGKANSSCFLKRQYDGYHFGARLVDVYNPFSLLNALDSMMILNYWFRSGQSYLIRLLNHTQENLDELTGCYYETPEFVDYKVDVEKTLPDDLLKRLLDDQGG